MPEDPNVKLCECGCGQPAPIAKQTKASVGHVKGQPTRFRRGHNEHQHRHVPGFKGSVRERLTRKVQIDPVTGCWIWTARRDRSGYGEIAITTPAGHRKIKAHRVAYMEFVGPIPDGMVVMHACDNPPCCNPEHLSIGTHAENNHDMWAKGRGSPPPH